MKLEVAARLFPEGSFIVAHIPNLDVASCGKTHDEAVNSLIEALKLFVRVCRDRGTLDQILMENGFVLQGDLWRIPGSPDILRKPEPRIGVGHAAADGCWTPENMIPLDKITQRVACVEI
jgi:hypothetical protein